MTLDSGINIVVLSSGLDDMRRGYETHQRILFSSLKATQGISSVSLVKRSGKRADAEYLTRTPSRDSLLCKFLGSFTENNSYWENFFFSLGFLFCYFTYLKKEPTHVLAIDPGVCRTLYKLIKHFRLDFRLVYTHGIANHPRYYFWHSDNIIEVNIDNFEQAVEFSENSCCMKNIALIPHFCSLRCASKQHSEAIRSNLNIKTKYTAICVGVIDSNIKRSDYVVSEFANGLEDWTLVLCGSVEDERIIELANSKLGHRFRHIKLSPDEMPALYQQADLLVLASVNEGFGYVLIEAMSNSLAILSHSCKRNHWIVKDTNQCIDMLISGSIANKLNSISDLDLWLSDSGTRNLTTYRDYYCWESVRDHYLNFLKEI